MDIIYIQYQFFFIEEVYKELQAWIFFDLEDSLYLALLKKLVIDAELEKAFRIYLGHGLLLQGERHPKPT